VFPVKCAAKSLLVEAGATCPLAAILDYCNFFYPWRKDGALTGDQGLYIQMGRTRHTTLGMSGIWVTLGRNPLLYLIDQLIQTRGCERGRACERGEVGGGR
jgi:hypothetical protein